MASTTLFQTNRSQAVRLPKDVAFPPGVREVRFFRDGPRRIIEPAEAAWEWVLLVFSCGAIGAAFSGLAGASQGTRLWISVSLAITVPTARWFHAYRHHG